MRAPSGFQVSWYWVGDHVVWAAMAAFPKTGACLLLSTTALSANQEGEGWATALGDVLSEAGLEVEEELGVGSDGGVGE